MDYLLQSADEHSMASLGSAAAQAEEPSCANGGARAEDQVRRRGTHEQKIRFNFNPAVRLGSGSPTVQKITSNTIEEQ